MNNNYEKTAVNLCNPSEVKQLLDELYKRQDAVLKLNDLVDMRIQNALVYNINLINILNTQIKEAIEEHGSYQDLETGEYAVKYARMKKSYNVSRLKDCYPKFVPLLIEETVNVKALEGQIKGGLLSVDELKEKDIITETPLHAFIIK